MARRNYEEEPRQRKTIDARAPMAAQNKGFGTGMTDPLNWANQFRRTDNQLTSLPTAIPAGKTMANMANPANAVAAPSITQSVLKEIMPNPFTFQSSLNLQTGQGQPGLQFGTAPTPVTPPLTQLASGGVNHAQSWLDRAKTGMSRVAPYVDNKKPMRTAYGRPENERFSWASAWK